MATTVYTYNDKVLKNVATDKWLKKPDAPAGFVMNASNATITLISDTYWILWQSPAYPNGYDGNGKSYTIVNNNSGSPVSVINGLLYLPSGMGGGPIAIPTANIETGSGTMNANQAGTASGFGMYLGMPLQRAGGGSLTEAEVQEYLSNITITILDP